MVPGDDLEGRFTALLSALIPAAIEILGRVPQSHIVRGSSSDVSAIGEWDDAADWTGLGWCPKGSEESRCLA